MGHKPLNAVHCLQIQLNDQVNEFRAENSEKGGYSIGQRVNKSVIKLELQMSKAPENINELLRLKVGRKIWNTLKDPSMVTLRWLGL